MLWLALRFTRLPPEPERAAALDELTAWAYDYTPHISTCHGDSLLLEISRCLRLFGGVELLCQRICADLDSLAPHYHLGLAHTAPGAWILSFQQHPPAADDSRAEFMQRLQAAPLHLLAEHPRAVSGLQQMGLGRLGEVLDLPRAELGRRFGNDFVAWLAGIEGSAAAPAPLFQAGESFHRQLEFNFPLRDSGQLEAPARELLQQLVTWLVSRQLQCQQICWQLCSPQHRRLAVPVSCSRVHGRWDMLLGLTRLHFERVQLDFDVERLELTCQQTVAVDLRSQPLFELSGCERTDEQARALVARLQARLGGGALYQIQLCPEHLPEYSQQAAPPFAPRPTVQAPPGPRPCWLLGAPQPLHYRGGHLYWHGALQLLRGPERIRGYWWQPAGATARDYFVARCDDARHYWVYRDGDSGEWYLHGLFA
ncbi:Y-family DNA polymerase [Parahaliea aestuarii]|uniref:DNA polymerase Y family protein n=1 Tax=Parahaliea aestuarii TaxID=1852021 RepID=A0A5C8ZVH7_9GAMM|nr:DNA polymerase Y family protein [Parahaliea aestuarii]TXS91467.1 DNA polymerase Y family protein [Parahaliea aestuarii]